MENFTYGSNVNVTVRSEPKTYRPDGEFHFFNDLLKSASPNAHAQARAEAARRMRQHQAEHRDITSTTMVGMVVPQFLVNLATAVVRVGGPLIDALPSMELPDEGMNMTLPRTTSALVGVTASTQTENTAVAEVDPSYTNVTEPVVTIAGEIDTSFQLVDRAGPVTDLFLAANVIEAVEDTLDQQVLAGDGTLSNMTGILSTTGISTHTWTMTTPTRDAFTQRIARLSSDVAGARRKVPTLIIMHSRRWYWLLGAPITETPGMGRPWQYQNITDEDPYVGRHGGKAYIIVDDHIPTNIGAATNQDVVAIVRSEDLPVLKGPTTVRVERGTRADQLGARIIGHRYAWFSGERYNGRSIGVLTGTGLVDPGNW